MLAFDDILSAICSQVKPATATEFQQVFLLADAKEAKLAYDVLLAQGFEVKLYPGEEYAKLYVTRPAPDSNPDEHLKAALVYAHALKAIKQSMDKIHQDDTVGVSDYTLTFANASSGKQIAIYMSPGGQQQATEAPRPVAATAANAPAPTVPARKPAPKKGHPAKPKEEDEFTAGSALAKSYPLWFEKQRKAEESSTRNALTRFFVQHIASNGIDILYTIFGILAIISFAVMMRGFICPDLAIKQKNVPWYCPQPQNNNQSQNG